ncbi:hypothetical protein DYB34_004030 [Aphanomyces astaci]|uniref:C2H2-type domain-containing protein n=1 Tax=Aphanomyces astaci TaxID=112090 RepID=A0A397F7Q0_APHAT|nr:hypothetical protein DYB34_004030 [Aphanomyces astaci]RHZ10159.1 hypothetical protein DYB31_000556 [Aphanomyces astaci]
MSSHTLEQIRSAHEDIESYERAIVSILSEKPRNVSGLLDSVTVRSADALKLYKDEEGTFKEEIDTMHGRTIFTSFYDQLKAMRDFHRKYTNIQVSHEPVLDHIMNPEIPFSGEERFGKYLDLHAFYTQYLNLPVFQSYRGARRVNKKAAADTTNVVRGRTPEYKQVHADYITYLGRVGDLSKIPPRAKLADARYDAYLSSLVEYLLSFYRRTQPLVDVDDVIRETNAAFAKDWSLRRVRGWQVDEHESNETFCRPCHKQFASPAVFQGHLNGKKHLKAVDSNNGGDDTRREQLARLEAQAKTLVSLLTEVVHATISFLELKQTRTPEELQAEIYEEEEGGLSDVDVDNDHPTGGDDDEQPFYNPLNLPLGWDGKPIPYWLYKLHGLGIEFKCEICGNHSYWGRRDFDRHFQQWRHAFGMRCLGIPNTKHFHDITHMADAIALTGYLCMYTVYEKLKGQLEIETLNKANEEEFEDSEGNVFNRKTYEDLARQGLL